MVAYLKKAPHRGAFFVSLFLLALAGYSPAWSAHDCSPLDTLEPLDVRQVVDGDTLRLSDGSLVRLIGIDTPELDHDGGQHQPYASEAHIALAHLVDAAGKRVLLREGTDRRDRYRRRLAHVYTPEGDNLTEALLRQGLGYQAVVAPNLAHLACYQMAEQAAREAHRGLWSKPVRRAANAGTGFQLLRDRVKAAEAGRRGRVWLKLGGGVVVKIPASVWEAMTSDAPSRFVGRRLEVRGWFYRYRGGLGVSLSHPASLHWL